MTYTPNRSVGMYIGFMLMPVGAYFLLLIVMPTYRSSVRWLAHLATLALLGLGTLNLVAAMIGFFSDLECRGMRAAAGKNSSYASLNATVSTGWFCDFGTSPSVLKVFSRGGLFVLAQGGSPPMAWVSHPVTSIEHVNVLGHDGAACSVPGSFSHTHTFPRSRYSFVGCAPASFTSPPPSPSPSPKHTETAQFGIQVGGLYVAGLASAVAAQWLKPCGGKADSPRETLIVLWLIFASIIFVGGIMYAAEGFAMSAAVSEGLTGVRLEWELPCQLIRAIVWMSIGVISFLSRARTKVHRMLIHSFARKENASAAAGVAALVGGGDPTQALKDASALFHCITLDRLTEAEMAENTPNPELFKRSEPAALGSVDAFISHSWSDDAPSKWVALQQWRAKFRSEHHGQEPRVWIDKCCIDAARPGGVDLQLRCLPIFLSGCKQLVAFTGSTYISRMWCVMELFVYLQMRRTFGEHTGELVKLPGSRPSSTKAEGHHLAKMPSWRKSSEEGKKRRTTVAGFVGAKANEMKVQMKAQAQFIAVAGGATCIDRPKEVAELRSKFETFQAHLCQCWGEETRQRLLAIVEGAFGSLTDFNQCIKDMIADGGLQDFGPEGDIASVVTNRRVGSNDELPDATGDAVGDGESKVAVEDTVVVVAGAAGSEGTDGTAI